MYTLIAMAIIFNAITFIAFGADKYFSILKKRRIRENTLLLMAILGGSLGAVLGQKIFNHKTQKFKSILWIILVVQIVVAWGLDMVFLP